jgi:hypothetical protein
MHISSVLKGFAASFQSFVQNQPRGKDNVDMKELGEVIKKLPEYIELKVRYELHYQILEDILHNIESK